MISPTGMGKICLLALTFARTLLTLKVAHTKLCALNLNHTKYCQPCAAISINGVMWPRLFDCCRLTSFHSPIYRKIYRKIATQERYLANR